MRVFYTTGRKLHGDIHCGHNAVGRKIREDEDENDADRKRVQRAIPAYVTEDDLGTTVCRYCHGRAKRLSFFQRIHVALFGGVAE